MWKNIINIVREHDIFKTNYHIEEREMEDLFHNLREKEGNYCNICGEHDEYSYHCSEDCFNFGIDLIIQRKTDNTITKLVKKRAGRLLKKVRKDEDEKADEKI